MRARKPQNTNYSRALLKDAKAVAGQIRRSVPGGRILLFGSGSRGEARQSSDLDIIVVAPSEQSFKERQRALYSLVDPPRGADLLWYTPQETEGMRDAGNSFIHHPLATAVGLGSE